MYPTPGLASPQPGATTGNAGAAGGAAPPANPQPGGTGSLDAKAELAAYCAASTGDVFQVLSNGTVRSCIDRRGYIWQQANGPRQTWDNANWYCANLRFALGTGLTWRIPTIEELDTLKFPNQGVGTAHITVSFPNTPAEGFWSSTASDDLMMAWDFNGRGPFTAAKSTQQYVRCISDG